MPARNPATAGPVPGGHAFAPEPMTNPQADRVKAVRRLATRSGRDRAGRFLAEGPQAVREAAAAAVHRPGLLAELYLTAEAARRYPEILEPPAAAGRARPGSPPARCWRRWPTRSPRRGCSRSARLVAVPFAALRGRAPAGRGAGPGPRSRQRRHRGPGRRRRRGRGGAAHRRQRRRAQPEGVRATAGSLFHLPVVAGVPLAEAVAGLRAAGLRISPPTAPADRPGRPGRRGRGRRRRRPGRPGRLALRQRGAGGCRKRTLALADAVVRVPVHGRAESLNLATAATVCLYATARAQRRGAGRRVGPPA